MQALDSKELALGLTIGGAVATALGAFFLMDDISDFPEVIAMPKPGLGKRGILKGLPLWTVPHIHHWLLALIIFLLGLVLLALGLLLLVKIFILKA